MKETKIHKYVSKNPLTGEIFYDRFNIDFLRYYTNLDALFGFIGSIIGVLLTYYLLSKEIIPQLNILYTILILGSIIFFILTSYIAYLATSSISKSTRIAGRRGLYTFVIMLLTATFGFIILGFIRWDMTIESFLRIVIYSMLIESIFAVPMDYSCNILKNIIKKEYNLYHKNN